jgi:hypothetical protein
MTFHQHNPALPQAIAEINLFLPIPKNELFNRFQDNDPGNVNITKIEIDKDLFGQGPQVLNR